MIEQGFGLYVTITLIAIVLLAASNVIPIFGFMRKSWKGCLLGCLVQPFICVVIVMLAVGVTILHQQYSIRKLRREAMVTIKKTETDSLSEQTSIWYLKPDEECFFEYKKTSGSKFKHSDENEKMELFDIVPLDSFRVCVDDRIIVKFDLESRRVTASEDDESIEVVRVDWDKVNSYFSRSSH